MSPTRFLKFTFLVLLFSTEILGQSLYLNVEGKSERETFLIDSIGYKKSFKNYVELKSEVDTLYNQIIKLGFLDVLLSELKKSNDTLYTSHADLGKRVKKVVINLNEQIPLYLKDKLGIEAQQDTLSAPIFELEALLDKLNSTLVEEGDPFSKLKLINIKKGADNLMTADLQVITNQLRRIDKIVVKGYEKFPKSFIKRFLRIREGDVFKLEELNEKTAQLSNLIFANQIRDPEVLFTKDSTTLYLYIEKNPSNNFDGFLGFGTNEETNRLELDGYLNLQLINNLNFGESLRISYKSDEIDQQTFDVRLRAPYLFKSAIGAEFGLNIFRKDSTFVTTAQNFRLNYQINPSNNIGIGINGIASSNLLDDDSELFEDYNSTFYLLTYNYLKPQFYDPLFPINFLIDLTISQGNRKTDLDDLNQTRLELESYKLFNLNRRNSIYIRAKGAALISDNYFDNELFRFGGINSIRGFEENSLVANLYGLLNSEYRYRLSNNLFVNSVIDLAYYENQLTDTKEELFGFGFGFGLLTQAGLFRFNYASAKTEGQPFRLSNSKVHISLTARF